MHDPVFDESLIDSSRGIVDQSAYQVGLVERTKQMRGREEA
jgi:hypothetical protein